MRGWVLEYGVPGAGAAYVAHPVVADLRGRLLDVTNAEGVAGGFLVHLGDVGTYLALVAAGRWAIVREATPMELFASWRPT